MLDVSGAPGYTSGDSTILTKGSRKKNAKCKKCNWGRIQNENIVEC